MQQASPFTASQVLSVRVESSRLRQSCELFEEIDAHGMHLVPDQCPLKRDPTGLSLVLAAGAACARQCCRHRVRGRIAAQAAFSWRFYPLEIDPVDLSHRPCGDQIQHRNTILTPDKEHNMPAYLHLISVLLPKPTALPE